LLLIFRVSYSGSVAKLEKYRYCFLYSSYFFIY